MLDAICFAQGEGWRSLTDLSVISELCAKTGHLVWADAEVSTLTSEAVALIAEEFGLHELAIEDAMTPRQRPKLENYADFFFAVVHQLDESAGQLEAVQVASFIGLRYVLVLHDGASRIVAETRRRLLGATEVPRVGSAFLVHALVDTVVDDHQDIADRLEAEVESVEETLLADPGARIDRELYSLKQRLARFRRFALPVGRILDEVIHSGKFGVITEEMREYFRDVHDHTVRVSEQVRNVDELASAALELKRAEQANALNLVTKRLTGWAAIIAVPTFIASVYGMNFRLFPQNDNPFGFSIAIGLMAVSGIGLYIFFRRRDWL